MRAILGIPAALLFLALAGCGGGGGDSGSCSSGTSSSTFQGGFYTGTLSLNGTKYSLGGIVDDAGNTQILESTTQGPFAVIAPSEPISDSQGRFSGQGFIYALSGASLDNGSGKESVSITGSVAANGSLCGTSKDGAGNTGTFTLDNNPTIYNVPSSISTIEGTYQFPFPSGNGLVNAAIQVQSNGAVSGSGPNCSMTGTATDPDPSVNVYSFTLTGSCFSGTFNALAYYQSEIKQLGIFGNDGAQGYALFITQQ